MGVRWKNGRATLDYYDQFGKRHQKRLPKGTTKKQAQDQYDEIKRAIKKETFIPDKEIPFFIDVANEWLELKKPSIRKGTFLNYEIAIRVHLEPFHFTKVSQIKTSDIEKFWVKKLDARAGLSTTRRALMVLGQIMRDAYKHRYIEYNPYLSASRPRVSDMEYDPDDELEKALSEEEIQALLDAEADPEFHCLYRTGLASGARQGELVALTWDDIDFEKRAIKINKTYSSGVLNKPKTPKSNRIIEKIASGAIDELAEWKEFCPKSDLNLVFPNKVGKYLDKADIGRRHLKPALKRAGLSDKITFHWLRHTYGSYLMLEESIQFVSKQMGHSSIAVTQKIYIHLIKDSTSEDLSERMEERMFGNLKKIKKLQLVKK